MAVCSGGTLLAIAGLSAALLVLFLTVHSRARHSHRNSITKKRASTSSNQVFSSHEEMEKNPAYALSSLQNTGEDSAKTFSSLQDNPAYSSSGHTESTATKMSLNPAYTSSSPLGDHEKDGIYSYIPSGEQHNMQSWSSGLPVLTSPNEAYTSTAAEEGEVFSLEMGDRRDSDYVVNSLVYETAPNDLKQVVPMNDDESENLVVYMELVGGAVGLNHKSEPVNLAMNEAYIAVNEAAIGDIERDNKQRLHTFIEPTTVT